MIPDPLGEVLAQPREAGTPEAARARDLLAARLRRLGYRVTVQPVPFAPTSLNAIPLFGAGLGWMALTLLPLCLLSGVPTWTAMAVWLVELAAIAALAVGVGLGATDPSARLREDANLIARRPGAVVRRWIVAHTDTKAQRQSTAGRIVALWVGVGGLLALGALAVWRLWGVVPTLPGVLAAVLALLGGFLAGRGRLHGRSLGARDNGSGLVAAMTVAARVADPAVGILLTGAEEFGLVGARVFARSEADRLAGVEVINLDTLDDQGTLYLVRHDRAGETLAARLAGELSGLGWPVRGRRLPLGVLVDSSPLARAGARAVTIGRLTWATLRRIHTPADTAEGFGFETATAVGEALARIDLSPGGG